VPYIGELELGRVHSGTLDQFITDRKKKGIAASTINRDIAIVRRILNLAAGLWRDEAGCPWLETPPMLALVQGSHRKPRPIFLERARVIAEGPAGLSLCSPCIPV
jgi:hypothetical protein